MSDKEKDRSKIKYLWHESDLDMREAPEVIDTSTPEGQLRYKEAKQFYGWLEPGDIIERQREGGLGQKLATGALGALDTLSLGFSDEIGAAASSALSGKPYSQTKAETDAALREARQQNPGSYQLGTLAPLAAAAGGGIVKAGAGAAKKALGSKLSQEGAKLAPAAVDLGARETMKQAFRGAAPGAAKGFSSGALSVIGHADTGEKMSTKTLGTALGVGALSSGVPMRAGIGAAKVAASPLQSGLQKIGSMDTSVGMGLQEAVPKVAKVIGADWVGEKVGSAGSAALAIKALSKLGESGAGIGRAIGKGSDALLSLMDKGAGLGPATAVAFYESQLEQMDAEKQELIGRQIQDAISAGIISEHDIEQEALEAELDRSSRAQDINKRKRAADDALQKILGDPLSSHRQNPYPRPK